MKKIAILHSGDLNEVSPGGISQYIEKIIKYNEENKITVFGTIDKDSEYILGNIYERVLEGRKYNFIPVNDNDKKPLSIFYFINIFKYFYMLNDYDIIYAQRMEYSLPFMFSKLKNKVIMAVHGSGMYSYMYWGNFIGKVYNFVERLAIYTSKKVIVLLKRDEFGVNYYKRKFKDKSNKFIYGKVPIDTEIFRKLNKNKVREKLKIKVNEKVLIYFGRLDNNPKRVMLLPDIVKELNKSHDNIKCIVIGNGEDREALINKINIMNLEQNFIVKNKLSHGDELVNYVNSADVSLILSNFEGICMSALESLACGVPVVATDVGDIKEYITEQFNGKVVENSTDKEVIINVSNYINEYFNGGQVKLNNIFDEYNGENVMSELNDIFNSIK